MLMPESTPVKVTALYRDDEEVEICGAGENLRLRLQGCEAENVHAGDVLCSANLPVRSVKKFEAQLAILEDGQLSLELLDRTHRKISTAKDVTGVHVLGFASLEAQARVLPGSANLHLLVVAVEGRHLDGRGLRHEHQVHPHLHSACLALPHDHGAHVAIFVHDRHAEGRTSRPVDGVKVVQGLE